MADQIHGATFVGTIEKAVSSDGRYFIGYRCRCVMAATGDVLYVSGGTPVAAKENAFRMFDGVGL